MRKVFLSAFIAVITLSTAAFAQSAEWYVDKPISEIRFIGLVNIDQSELDGITDQFIGKNFTDTLFWDLQSKLYSLNYFDNFTANAVPMDGSREKVIIEFTVTERPLIKNIIFRGNLSITKSKILEVISLKQDDIVNNARIRMDEAAIKELYIDEGYPDVTVESSVEDAVEEGFVELFFSIVEGTQTRINSISFSGNTFASDNTLKSQLESKEQTFFSKGIFQEGLIEKDKAAISKYYSDSGFLDIKIIDAVITEAEVENKEERNYIDIVFYLEEGEEWLFGGFEFEGNTLFSDEELLKVTSSTVGKSINKSRLESDFIAIGDIYYNDGYIYNNMATKEIRNDETNEISFQIIITEKNRAHIENIIINGNEKTKDEVILREIPLEVGDVFSKSAIMEGLNNLYNTRYFSSVVPEMPYGSELGLMDVVINVEEQNTTDVQFGLTFTDTSSSIPVYLFLKWNESNFKGEGKDLSVGLELSSSSQELSFSYTDSWLFDRRISGGVELSFSHDSYTSVEQDILLPIFSLDDDDDDYDDDDDDTENDQVVPDPYDGHWVWADDADDNSYSAGDAVDTDDYTDDELEELAENETIQTDYDYAMDNDESIDSEYLMDYESYTASLSASGGYTVHTSNGRVSLGTGASTALSYLTYDDSLYRPFDKDIRDALNTLLLTNKLWLTASWDTRDLIYSPTKGFILKETLTYTGGLLFGSKDYIKTTTDADFYLELFDFPVTDVWNFSTVMGIHAQYSMILPQYYYSDGSWSWGNTTTSSDELYIDGMFIARGWDTDYGNKALFDLVVDFTTPLAEGLVSWNTFISGTGLWEELSDMKDMSIDDYYFSLGTGLQLDIPSFPISFFLVKRAKYEDGVFTWQQGDDLFVPDDEDSPWGLDLVITFDLDYF
ncbi:MAG: outer membrane protein assembly factor BamA [Spirochaetales bacterium]|uniref:Outer membrane protein assembly factor BamA n=1 Tax=Candidatus Thalassospirochaeta sargassi TaxID=3119039 RepID=A0AAJ1MI44_9SPIO|nr:outer membrane protein assembly factor BamA [Spirochaetales bacterium]